MLEVVYLIFNEGFFPTVGDRLVRPELMEEALRLGRVLAELLPREAEVHGLVALRNCRRHARGPGSRRRDGRCCCSTRTGRAGTGCSSVAALERAYATGGPIGPPYTLQAGIAACHARARVPEDTDWHQIVALYDGLAQLTPSPVVELNRAVALGMAFGAREGLRAVDALREEPVLDGYGLLPSVRGDLLEKLGRLEEARVEFERAARLTTNARQQTALLERAAACAPNR